MDNEFFEYHTTDMQGRDITPKTNVVNFVCKDQKRSAETIMSADSAKQFTLKNVFPDWEPGKIAKQLFEESNRVKKAYLL